MKLARIVELLAIPLSSLKISNLYAMHFLLLAIMDPSANGKYSKAKCYTCHETLIRAVYFHTNEVVVF